MYKYAESVLMRVKLRVHALSLLNMQAVETKHRQTVSDLKQSSYTWYIRTACELCENKAVWRSQH